MDPMTALALGSLGAGIIGGGINTANSAYQTEENRNFAREENEKNRALQKDLAMNAYQYAVEDMRKAGLNPYLAYGNGGAHGVSGSSIGSQTQSKVDTQSFMSGLSLAKDFLELGNKKSSAMEAQPKEVHIYKDYGVDNHYYSKG